MTQIHLGINIGLQYIRNTDEYILKLQIHQHSLLTRKVFSRHNLSEQVFFSVSAISSSIHLCLQVIFIFKSSSSSSHLHLDLDHHWIWIIITRAGSSLDLDHHHRCYLVILLFTWSSTEPALFHAGCRPSHHVGLLQCLYLTLSQNGPPSTYIWPTRQKGTPKTYIWSCRNQSYNHIRKAQHSHSPTW